MITPSTYAELVERTFGPALAPKGFAPTVHEDFRVRLEAPSAFVLVAWEPASHELTVWLGEREGVAEPPLELGDVLCSTDCRSAEIDGITLMQSGEPEVLKRLMARAAALIDRYASGFLAGDPLAFRAAVSQRADRARVYTQELMTRRVIAEADEAWRRRDYESVYSELSPISDSLDDTHRRRLELAAARIAPPPGERG